MSNSTPKSHISLTTNMAANLDYVQTVKSRLVQLNDSQATFLDKFGSVDNNFTWPDYLSLLTIILSKHINLSNTLIDSNLRKLTLFPKEPLPPESEHILATLLRTKQIPEVSNLEQEILSSITVQEGLESQEAEANLDKEDEERWDALLKEWVKRYEVHDRVCTEAARICEDMVGARESTRRLEGIGDDKTEEEKDDITLEDVLSFISSGVQNGKGPTVIR
ncbi:9810_t:CDS:2 [Paraglomus occultum]|uniref:Mediator of RNA polymerase II transcription subunit 8 n=1 Tax=Paraglomus occultum TaxID=144539 RepID=A0A9N8Z0G0_9GLOM|nr:9810_t:CDS:2 [Paraglomus occultum]